MTTNIPLCKDDIVQNKKTETLFPPKKLDSLTTGLKSQLFDSF